MVSLAGVMGWGCPMTELGSPGHAPTVRPGRRLSALWAFAVFGSLTPNHHRVQVSGVCVRWPRRRGPGRGRPFKGDRRLQASVKAELVLAGGDAGPTAHYLASAVGVKRDAGDSLGPGAASSPQPL